jgi:hypothetical protein
MTIGACQKLTDIVGSSNGDNVDLGAQEMALHPVINPPAPAPLTAITFGERSLTLWPFTSNDISGTPQDPINLVFTGKCDPRRIRAALMSLDGDRTALGFPPMPPFNSQWKDAIGDVQSGYGDDAWTGGVIQLACGDYGPARFHIRLFTTGEWTVANAHFEVLIPGTADHQVLSWEVAEQFVIAEFMRSGLLDASAPMLPTGQINPSPFRTIPAIIYNGLPAELKALIGGPAGTVTDDVPIGTDGHAMILNIGTEVPIVPGREVQQLTITYGQVIPKPFCNTGADYVYVQGPVDLAQVVTITPELKYQFSFRAQGTLSVTPINPLTGEPIGPPLQANVSERHWGSFIPGDFAVTSMKTQRILPADAPGAGSLSAGIVIRSDQHNAFSLDVRCASESLASQ